MTTLWQSVPFRHMTALVIALLIIREQFPFSHFPMYSGASEEADVLYVTDQSDRVIAMKSAFDTGSAATKKTWKSEVATLCEPQGRGIEQATQAEREQAARIVLAALIKRLEAPQLPPGVRALRLYQRTFALRDGKQLTEPEPALLAEQAL